MYGIAYARHTLNDPHQGPELWKAPFRKKKSHCRKLELPPSLVPHQVSSRTRLMIHVKLCSTIFYEFHVYATHIFPLSYAVSELWKDVEKELLSFPESDRDRLRAATKFGIFVVHNKTKTKLAELVGDTPSVTLSTLDAVSESFLDISWEPKLGMFGRLLFVVVPVCLIIFDAG